MLSTPRTLRDILDEPLFDDDLAWPSSRSSLLRSLPLRHHHGLVPSTTSTALHHRFAPSEIGVATTHGDKFKFNLDMAQFDPSEISIKYADGQLTVHGKKERKMDDNGTSYVYREYVQKCSVPDNVLADQLVCKVDPSGYVRIEAPLKVEVRKDGSGLPSTTGRYIPIEFGGSSK